MRNKKFIKDNSKVQILTNKLKSLEKNKSKIEVRKVNSDMLEDRNISTQKFIINDLKKTLLFITLSFVLLFVAYYLNLNLFLNKFF
jgi:hypothetical protein